MDRDEYDFDEIIYKTRKIKRERLFDNFVNKTSEDISDSILFLCFDYIFQDVEMRYRKVKRCSREENLRIINVLKPYLTGKKKFGISTAKEYISLLDSFDLLLKVRTNIIDSIFNLISKINREDLFSQIIVFIYLILDDDKYNDSFKFFAGNRMGDILKYICNECDFIDLNLFLTDFYEFEKEIRDITCEGVPINPKESIRVNVSIVNYKAYKSGELKTYSERDSKYHGDDKLRICDTLHIFTTGVDDENLYLRIIDYNVDKENDLVEYRLKEITNFDTDVCMNQLNGAPTCWNLDSLPKQVRKMIRKQN